MALKTIINGIDVDRQRAPSNTVARSASSVPAICTEWIGGTQTRTDVSAGRFAIHSDYPKPLLGSGTAPSPLELLVTAAAASFVTSFVLAASAADVRIEAMRVRTAAASDEAAAATPQEIDWPITGLVLIAEVDAGAPLADLRHLGAIAIERAPVLALCGLDVRVDIKPVNGSTP